MKSSGIKIDGGSDLSTQQARDLAAALIEEADRSDARVEAKKASEDRRRKWRDREVAAGRMKVFNAGDFFNRR